MAVKDYDRIARKKIRKPSDLQVKYPRFLVYSRNKKGKTWFCLTAPNVLVLDPENGTDEFTKRDPNVWPIDTWSDLDEAYHFLKGGNHSYEWLAVDGVTRMSNMSLRFVMRKGEERDLDRTPGMVQRQDYGKAGELLKGMILNFQTLPMGIVYTAQERLIDVTSEDLDDDDAEDTTHMFVPDLPKGTRGTLNSVVGVIGRLYVVKAMKKVRRDGEVIEKPYPQRRLWIGDHVAYDTGFRSEFTNLPPMLKDPTVERLTNLIRKGNARG